MISKKVLDALKNVTQSRGYSANEEAIAKALLAKHVVVPPPEKKPAPPPKAPPLDLNNPLFQTWAKGFDANVRGIPAEEEWRFNGVENPYKDWYKNPFKRFY